MKIAFFVYGYLPWDVYGIPRYIDRLTRHLSNIGHKIWIITRRYQKLPKIEKIQENLTIYRTFHINLKPIKRLSFFNHLWDIFFYTFIATIEGCKLIRDNKIQILHGHHLIYGGLQATLTAYLLKRPSLVTIHGSGLDPYSKYKTLPLILRYLNYSNLKIICQKSSAVRILTNWNFKPEKIILLKAFVDTIQFSPIKKKKHERFKNIVFIGRMIPFKGPELLIDAIPIIIEKIPNVRFIFAGDGELLEILQEKVRALEIENYVRFLGVVDKIEEIYAIADVSVLLSVHENSTDMTLLESMAFGIPVVATRVGETEQIIKDGITGVLVKYDPKDLASKLCKLLQDVEFSKKLGQNARKYLLKEYSLSKFGQIHEGIYRYLNT